jgi:DNA-binding CsgD family transcriptional regulator
MICSSATFDTKDEVNAVRRSLRAKEHLFVAATFCETCDAYHIGPDRESRPPLSPRRLEIMNLVAAGYTADEIAATLGTTRAAVQVHVKLAKKRFYANSAAHLVAVLISLGIIDPTPFVPTLKAEHA